jgi:hypothetical protein
MKLNFTKQVGRYFKAAIGGCLTFALFFQVAFYAMTGVASAASMSEMADKVQDKAGQAIDNVAGSIDRTAEKIRETAKDNDIVGRAQEQVNKVKAAADENEYRNRGRARAAIENTQDKIVDAKDKIGSDARVAADNAKYEMRKGMNKAESEAKQVKAKGEETGGNVIDAIKGMFGK